MKAKEMAERFNASPTDDTLIKIAVDCVKETKVIAEARGVRSNHAMAAVIREMDDKWRAFARLCPSVAPDGFRTAIHRLVPVSKEVFP